MTRPLHRRLAGGWACALILAAAATAQEPAPPTVEDEPVSYETGADSAFEEIAPPEIVYEDYAGPDPVLEGAPPASRPDSAAEQRVRELQQGIADAPPGDADAEPTEFGVRTVAEVVMALCIVLGLIIVVLLAVRRLGGRTPFLAGAALGQVLGRVYLTPKASLHFVRTGGKVLVIGVTQESVQLVETFDADAFAQLSGEASPTEPSGEPEGIAGKGNAFLAQLREQTARIRQPADANPADANTADDGDITTLRDDIERLQRMLREATRD